MGREIFLKHVTKSTNNKRKFAKLYYIKIKNFYSSKHTQKYKVKLQGKISAKHKTDERKLKTRKKSDQVLHKDENLTGLKTFFFFFLTYDLISLKFKKIMAITI